MAKRKKGLGRGFDTLIPSVTDEGVTLVSEADAQGSHAKSIKIQDIIASPDQPRQTFDDQSMKDLVLSIKTHGIMQPIVVVRDGARYKLVAGERRWRAASELGLDTMPAIIRTLDEQQRLELSLIENLQREDLNPIEIAQTLVRLADQFSLGHDALAKRVGKAKTTVVNTMRLVNLSDKAKKALAEGKISEGHGRAILSLDGRPDKQELLLDHIVRHGWSVRQAEQYAMANKKSKIVAKPSKPVVSTINDETKKLTKWLKTKEPVRLQPMAKGRGRIIIEFKDDKEYKAITKKLLKPTNK